MATVRGYKKVLNNGADMVSIPLSDEDFDLLKQKKILLGERQCFQANSALRDTFQLSNEKRDDEEAEYAAFLMAGLWSLIKFGRRLILIAEVTPSQIGIGAEIENGGCIVSDVTLNQITAYFTESENNISVDFIDKIRSFDIDQAWLETGVQEYLVEQQILWHDVSEIG